MQLSHNVGASALNTYSFGNVGVYVCVCVVGMMGVCGGRRWEMINKNPSSSRPFTGSLINTSERKLAAFLLAWLLLLQVVARLSSLITGKFNLLNFHLEQEDVSGNSSDSVAILTQNLDNGFQVVVKEFCL